MADDTYDPFNLRKHPGYYAELVQERDPTHDVAASYVKNHQYDGGILGQLERNPHGLGDSPLPFDPTGAELRSTSEGGSAFTERPKDHMQPVAELISPTLGAFGAGQMAGTAYKEAGEGDYQEAGMSLAPLLAGMVVPGAPKGVRGPKAITREIDARGFYSPSLEAVKGLGQESGTVQQFRSMLLKAGGKPKELEAVGFDRAFPDPNAKVSRQEIEQYLRDNRVQLGEHELFPDSPDNYDDFGSDVPENSIARYESYSTPGGIPGSYREVVTTLNPQSKARFEDLKARRRELSESEAMELEQLADVYDRNSSNYYESSHWPGITNPVLHYRTKDFVDGSGNRSQQAGSLTPSQPSLPGASGRASGSPSPADGRGDLGSRAGQPGASTEPAKIRVLDEMQSDWAQRARDNGIRSGDATQLKAQRDAALKARDDVYAEIDALAKKHGYEPSNNTEGRGFILKMMRHDAVPGTQELTDRMLQTGNDYLDLSNKYSAASQGVPSAPYISNTSDWVDLGLKQALIDAAKDPSVNRLAWAPGKVQADRYSLAKHVESFDVVPHDSRAQDPTGRTLWMKGKNSGPDLGAITVDKDGVITRADNRYGEIIGRPLSDVIGREPAAKVMGMDKEGVLSGLDLSFGGEGMKSFYGDMTPEGYQSGIVGTRLQKLVKGLDPEAARVEPTKIEIDNSKGPSSNEYDEIFTSEQYPSVKITPAMREKILKEGLPLFNVAALSALVSRILGQGQPDTEGEDGGGF
jgi:PAS domain-containing protein